MSEDQSDKERGGQLKSVLDNLADNFRDWTTTATEKAGEFTRVAAEKAEELGKLGKLKMDIYQLQRERQKALSAVGLITFSSLTGEKSADWEKGEALSELINRVKSLDKEIAAKEAHATVDGVRRNQAEASKNGTQKKAAAKPKRTTAKKTKPKTTARKK